MQHWVGAVVNLQVGGKLLGLATFAVFLFTAPLSPVRADEEIPTYKTLTCGHECPQITKPVLINDPSINFPNQYRGLNTVYVEGLVDVRYTIGADGRVTDASIEQLLGPQEFADRALADVRARQYKPALENGTPVAVNWRVRFMFRIKDAEQGAREQVVKAYHHAVLLADEDKLADAIAALEAIEKEPDLNFYERTMTARVLAVFYARTEDYDDALKQIRIATIEDGAFLSAPERVPAIRLRMDAEAQVGNWAEALAWFEILKKYTDVAADDHAAALASQIHALIDGTAPIVLATKIPADTPQEWQHTLLRRSFSFAGVEGKLGNFALRCDVHGIESAVSDKANWTVPGSWSGCTIYVEGAPGTRFKFVETRSTKS